MPSHYTYLSQEDRIERKIDNLTALVTNLTAQGKTIMTALTDLQDQMKKLSDDVDVNTTDTAAAVAEIKSLLDQIAHGIGSGASDADLSALTAQASALVAKVEASNAALAGAIPPSAPAAPAA